MLCGCPALVALLASSVGAVHITQWENAVAGAENLYCGRLELIRRNAVAKKEYHFTGHLLGMKPNYVLWRLAEHPAPDGKPDPNNYMAYIRSGTFLYEYDGYQKCVTEYAIPSGSKATAGPPLVGRVDLSELKESTLLSFTRREHVAQVFCTTYTELSLRLLAAWGARWILDGVAGAIHNAMPFSLLSDSQKRGELVARYSVKAVKHDNHYVYLKLTPRRQSDKHIESVTFVLTRPDCSLGAYLPAAISAVTSNGQETENWFFADVRLDVPDITPETFRFVPPPADWKVLRAAKSRNGR